MKTMLLTVLLIGCAAKEKPVPTSPKKDEGRYATGSPGEGWSRVSPGGADRAWFHKKTGSTIYFDSNCKARFEDKPLPDLMKHLTFGMAQGDPITEEALTLGGRSALLRVYAGEVDGVNVRIGAVVAKKNSCLYDGLYISNPSDFDTGMASFRNVLDGFKS